MHSNHWGQYLQNIQYTNTNVAELTNTKTDIENVTENARDEKRHKQLKSNPI